MTNQIQDIIFEYIDTDKKYAYGKYGDFKVVIMRENGYINASKLVSETRTNSGKVKELKSWKENKESRELISEIESDAGIPASLSVDDFTLHGLYDTRGTYVHPLLVPHIMSWASPKFAIKVSKIVNEFYIKEYKESIRIKDDKIDELIRKVDNQRKENMEMKQCVQEQTRKIDAQSQQINDQSRQIQELLNYGKQTVSKLEDAEQDRDIIKTHLEDVSSKLEDVSIKLDIAVEDRVPKPEDKSKTTTFVMIENDSTSEYQFHVIRRQQNSVNTEIKKYLKENPGSKEFLRIEEQPNAMNLLIRIKESMKKDLVFYRNDLSSKTMTKEDLKSKILKIHNERKDV